MCVRDVYVFTKQKAMLQIIDWISTSVSSNAVIALVTLGYMISSVDIKNGSLYVCINMDLKMYEYPQNTPEAEKEQ